MRAEDLVLQMPVAAFCRGPSGKVSAWNPDAENLLGLPSRNVLGSPCHAVLDGCDELGAYCYVRCPSWRSALLGEPVRPYAMQVRRAGGRRIRVVVTILVAADVDGLSLIHVMEPCVDTELLDDLRDETDPGIRPVRGPLACRRTM